MSVARTLWTLLFTSLATNQLFAASIPWRIDVNRAIGESVKTGKPLMIGVSTEWCHYCKKMDLETFSQAEVVSHVTDCFIPLKLDGERDHELAERLGVRGFPTTVFVSPELKILSSVSGFRTAEQFHEDLHTLCSHVDDETGNRHTKLSAFGHNCPVTSLTERKMTPGSEEFSLRYRGYDLRFASAAARSLFKRHTNSFWPIGDGHCAVSVLDDGTTTFGSWEHSLVYSGRIWWFASREHKLKFQARSNEYVSRLIEMVRGTPSKEPNAGIVTVR